MQTFDQTVAALGAPMSRVALDDLAGRKLVVARWRHRDAHVKISSADAFRVALSLGFEQKLHHTQADLIDAASCVPGDISIYPPGLASETMVEGEADVVQIFIGAGPLALGGTELRISTPLLKTASEDLRASALALFMTDRGKAGAPSPMAAAMLCRTVHQIFAAREINETRRHRGGMPAASMRRVEKLIKTQLDFAGRSRLNVRDLAAEAGLSTSHFIYAFRQATGTTPYQYIMAQKRQRAMALLRRPQMSISDVGDELGFSSPAHFVAAFRERFGTTPGEYRQAVLDPNMFRSRSRN